MSEQHLLELTQSSSSYTELQDKVLHLTASSSNTQEEAMTATIDYISISNKLTALIRLHGRPSSNAGIGLPLVLDDNSIFFGIHANGKEFVSFDAVVGGKLIRVSEETFFNAEHWLSLLEQKYPTAEVTP
jgi:hypothetical protein